jgi:hypothetical protein
MRCRAGDLAVIIRAKHPDNLHKLVRVVRAIDPENRDNFDLSGMGAGHKWVIETLGSPFVRGPFRFNDALALDTSLRPIRDNDGVDETLLNLELIV